LSSGSSETISGCIQYEYSAGGTSGRFHQKPANIKR
jgi:hypothetical protein